MQKPSAGGQCARISKVGEGGGGGSKNISIRISGHTVEFVVDYVLTLSTKTLDFLNSDRALKLIQYWQIQGFSATPAPSGDHIIDIVLERLRQPPDRRWGSRYSLFGSGITIGDMFRTPSIPSRLPGLARLFRSHSEPDWAAKPSFAGSGRLWRTPAKTFDRG